MTPRNLYEKIFLSHLVTEPGIDPPILYIDRQFLHEVTSPQAFAVLSEKKQAMHRADLHTATIDHVLPTSPIGASGETRLEYADTQSRIQINQLINNCKQHNVELFGLDHPNQGIVHVIGPELGLTQPGMTIVCGDSHTATHGAFGALAFGIGTSEVSHVMGSQCLIQKMSKSMLIEINGSLGKFVTSKDIILAIIARYGTSFGTGYVIEYAGSTISTLNMEERMTICNMSIEAGARSGLIAPDDITFDYMKNRPYAPKGENWHRAVSKWKELSDIPNPVYDEVISINAEEITPMITYGTNPGMGISINESIPAIDRFTDQKDRNDFNQALNYMDFIPGEKMMGKKVDKVFIGSCTNGRLTDLKQAAEIIKRNQIAPEIDVLIVPGSYQVKRAAEKIGLDKIFIEAGAQWREPGCSMCLGMNGDIGKPGELVMSTSNRNFEGRQGRGVRTILCSPYTAAAAAVTGQISHPNTLEENNEQL